MPPFARRTLRARVRDRCHRLPPPGQAQHRHAVAYFHGCGANYYEPELGRLAILILERLGYHVILPPQGCCGLPLQSNGLFASARQYARYNLDRLLPFVQAGIPIVGTSTSCTLSFKHDYRDVLGLQGHDFAALSANTFDFFEFLTSRPDAPWRQMDLGPVPARVLYHPPCQLKSHGMGTPAVDVLRRIPGLHLTLSEAECCGVAGTYGMKVEKYRVARDVGLGLMNASSSGSFDIVATDSETCRWWLAGHTGVPAAHPVELLARALAITSSE
jgi:glycerol-3-phosphate dehydrogenase subunit C